MKKIKDIKLKFTLLLIVVFATSISCERAWVEPYPPDGARDASVIWENYNWSKGFLEWAWYRSIFATNFNDIQGDAHTASASDEAKHSVPNSAVERFTNGAWSPTNTVNWRYGGTHSNQWWDVWENSYTSIRKINIFLEAVDNSAVINDPVNPAREFERDEYKGMAYFLRAWVQWNLFQRYGSFPVIDRPLLYGIDDIFLPRNTLAECYAQIMKDLDSAYHYLPVEHSLQNWHRPTKIITETVRARVQLYWASPLYQGVHAPDQSFGLAAGDKGDIARWENVIATVRKAINENNYFHLNNITNWATQPISGSSAALKGTYTGALYYRLLRDNPGGRESIWSTTQTGQQRPLVYSWEQQNMPDGVLGAWGLTNPSQEMVDAFEVVPLRAGLYRPVEGATSEAFDWDNPVHAANPYANRDPRFYHAITFNGILWGTNAAYRYNIHTWEGGTHNNPSRPNATKTGYYMRKGLSETFHWVQSGRWSTVDRFRPQFRMAELLLIYAEAMNFVYGPDVAHPDGPMRPITIGAVEYNISSAREALNMVRARVEMPPVPAGLSEADFFERVVHERRIELAFEGHRMFDLRRWKMGEILGQPIHGIRITSQDPDTPGTPPWNYEVFQVENRVWEDKMYWWPIQNSEVLKYGGRLKQSPGW